MTLFYWYVIGAMLIVAVIIAGIARHIIQHHKDEEDD